MRYHVLATDYDGTLAHDGVVAAATIAALEAVRRSGRRLVLVTGRVLDDLATVFHRFDLFDRIVAENGAVLHRPATRETRVLAPPPDERFTARLRQRGVPFWPGHVVVATLVPYAEIVLDAIRASALELQVVFNKGALMVLPSGTNKATGLACALAELKLSEHNTVAVGDAENDHAFLAACECGVAVANALAALKEHADLVTVADHGAGVQELAAALLQNDLADNTRAAARAAIPVGLRGVAPLSIPAHGPPVLVVDPSAGGTSTFATRLIEELATRRYQFCVLDPEGDYRDLEQAAVLGDASRAPRVEELLDLLDDPARSCVANLRGVPLDDRPGFVEELVARLFTLRAWTGRPHWIIADEAHHCFPAGWRPGEGTRPEDFSGLLLVTGHPDRVARDLLACVGAAVAVGADAVRTMTVALAAIGARETAIPSPAAAEALAWVRGAEPDVGAFTVSPPRAERRRHMRAYAAGDLGPAESFWFRGAEGRLRLRAGSLRSFLELADGVDDDTWEHHRAQGDYSRWFRAAIKDAELAAEAEAIERDRSLGPAASRARLRDAIERRYTAPA